MMRHLLVILLLVVAATASAAEGVRHFVTGSMATIQEEHAGKPFVLFLWSLTCTYCPTELKMLGEFRQQHPELNLVLIAADTPEEEPEIVSHLADYGLNQTERWVFAEEMPERLRFEIDRRWYGEVPRTYFYDRNHLREVKTGLVGEEYVKNWLVRVEANTSSAGK
ncbi:TlpA disulfide reductase family protein [Nitrosomonas sp.]|uniref:TlpA disulfide reductase family protein n=1 Tax=Nitrosomonas sp. TaxID=42353 RepID=UPI0025D99F32|nr:TlpA disulfide reductase family protein [Nitrosomonas sp.]MCC6915698.1 TlpA family protein disulfide reductase [Nitrosomonas sp.]